MIQHFVTFYSPGTLMSETRTVDIESWDVDQAVALSEGIVERHGARPYGFRFSTRERKDSDLDSREVNTSPMYFLGGVVETLEEIEARNDPREEILRSNMRNNGYDRVLVNTNSYRFVTPIRDSDIVLDV